MRKGVILTIDQGTTGTRSLVVDRGGHIAGKAYEELRQHYPKPSWVEHDAAEIWAATERTMASALADAGARASDVAAIGITNQRETSVVWDAASRRPIHHAIVWQCRRTAPECEALRRRGLAREILRRTGLQIDAYFSGTKIAWTLDHVPGARRLAEQGKLRAGTIDSWLLENLSAGEAHVTDFTNASRTMLFNLRTLDWDARMLAAIRVPRRILPRACPSSGVLARTRGLSMLPDGIPIAGVAGDQQAALYGQLCHRPGMAKNTYGTGCFLLLHLGGRIAYSRNGLVTTVACAADGGPAYALEGSVFIAGAAVQWLRDELRLLDESRDSAYYAAKTADTGGVYVVPAFVGLGAPYWDMGARGAILGLTRGSGRAEIVRATLESIAYQTRDVIDAMERDTGRRLSELRVDGGAAANDLLMQFQADILGTRIDRPREVEVTALGAAYLAGVGVGFWKGASDLARLRRSDRRFEPSMPRAERERRYAGWREAVSRVRTRP